jgi:hypothetical protein
MGKAFRQGAGPGDGLAAPHQLEGLLEITRFAEFPLNQAGQGRPFFQGKQGRSREIAGCQITGSWLAQLLVTSGEIKDVIHHLKGQAQLAAKTIQIIELLRL